ncbi:hypothetical protein IWZ03DRAFT_39502 [Phyllosticta citriasiana]|uniref:Secreted protein n=1 Tax=Phyllosticta citriasiana TaxID=595635 RepID=A0ABR1KE38_9PEZI
MILFSVGSLSFVGCFFCTSGEERRGESRQRWTVQVGGGVFFFSDCDFPFTLGCFPFAFRLGCRTSPRPPDHYL